MVFRNMMWLGGQPLVLGPIVDTYIKYFKSNILVPASVSTLNGSTHVFLFVRETSIHIEYVWVFINGSLFFQNTYFKDF